MKKSKAGLPAFRPRNGHVSAMLKLNGGNHSKPYRVQRRQEKAKLRSETRAFRGGSEGFQHKIIFQGDFLQEAFNFHPAD